jgi:peptidylprolyl isomerase
MSDESWLISIEFDRGTLWVTGSEGPNAEYRWHVLTHMVEQGHTAVVHYTGRIIAGDDAGEVFDTTDVDTALAEEIYHDYRDYAPLSFQVDGDEVLEGIDETVQKMDSGETRTVRVDPEKAYGMRSEERVIEVSRAALEERSDIAAAEGELVGSENSETGWVTNVSDETVEIDFNHELAGEPVEFEIRVLEVRDKHEDDENTE